MENRWNKLLIVVGFLFVLQFLIYPALAEDEVVVEFFYSSKCGSCKPYSTIIEEVEQSYNESVFFIWLDLADSEKSQENYDKMHGYNLTAFPNAVVDYETRIPKDSNLTRWQETLEFAIDSHLANITPNVSIDEGFIDIPFFGRINVSDISLPVLTIVLAGVDSLNPCSFFILLILLSLLIYAESRRRMLLIGGIFVFFSGLFYFVFMYVLLNSLLLTVAYIDVITIVVGAVSLVLGFINIKDFFFFKKGASLGVSEEKKPGIFKQIRDLVKTPYVATAVFGTIVLAVMVNFYELLCTLELPLIYVTSLTSQYPSAGFDFYVLHIFFYNVVYVIPLVVIVLIFAFTLGRMKLSEWHGRVLKLFSGLLISSFGILFIVDYQILSNVFVPLLLLLYCLVGTFIVSFIWKKYMLEDEG
jgi:thiol-disulfide isomerase/thioredoxin